MENTEKYGKFESADALLSAYNALETEFTKRCQLIKQLQAELEAERSRDDAQPIDDGDAQVTEETASAQADGAMGEAACRKAGETTADIDAEVVVTQDPPAKALSDDEIINAIAADAARFAALLSDMPQIMDACIARYKEKLIGLADVSPVLCGRAVLTPAKKPRTLADAKRLADELLCGN